MTRLVESIRGLDGAMSLSEVLDALALAAARETARAAVVVIKADRIVGWRLSGFGMRDSQPKSIDMSMAEAGVIGQAASSSRAATTRDGQNDGPGFEQIPGDRMGLAMPVRRRRTCGGRALRRRREPRMGGSRWCPARGPKRWRSCRATPRSASRR